MKNLGAAIEKMKGIRRQEFKIQLKRQRNMKILQDQFKLIEGITRERNTPKNHNQVSNKKNRIKIQKRSRKANRK